VGGLNLGQGAKPRLAPTPLVAPMPLRLVGYIII